MSVDKFGQYSSSSEFKPRASIDRGQPGIGFRINSDGNFDLEGKLLTNLSIEPVKENDAVTKKYVDLRVEDIRSTLISFSTQISTIPNIINDLTILNQTVKNIERDLASLNQRANNISILPAVNLIKEVTPQHLRPGPSVLSVKLEKETNPKHLRPEEQPQSNKQQTTKKRPAPI